MKTTLKTTIATVALASGLLLSGCATIVGDKNQLMAIASTPTEATISITDETGAEIFKGATPTTVTLAKSSGNYWGKKSYTVKISKDGFQQETIALTAHANGWYIAGNLVFGGLIGWFVVDPFNGGMYTLSPDKVSAQLAQKTALNGKSGALNIVLLQDVPEGLRKDLKRIN